MTAAFSSGEKDVLPHSVLLLHTLAEGASFNLESDSEWKWVIKSSLTLFILCHFKSWQFTCRWAYSPVLRVATKKTKNKLPFGGRLEVSGHLHRTERERDPEVVTVFEITFLIYRANESVRDKIRCQCLPNQAVCFKKHEVDLMQRLSQGEAFHNMQKYQWTV